MGWWTISIKKAHFLSELSVIFLFVNAVEIVFDVRVDVNDTSLASDIRLDVDRDYETRHADDESYDESEQLVLDKVGICKADDDNDGQGKQQPVTSGIHLAAVLALFLESAGRLPYKVRLVLIPIYLEVVRICLFCHGFILVR